MDFQFEPHFEPSPVKQFYRNKSVFVTGATGFVGKTVVEKLLRTCPSLKSIYILLRAKKSLTLKGRLDNLLASSIFDKLRESNPNFSQKIFPLSGDVTLPDLGLSNDDQCLLQEAVHVVVHSAACIKFNEFIKTAIDTNFHGTRKVLQLCKTMKQLEAFIHVSTAYTNAERTSIEEIVYPFASKSKIEKFICEIEAMDDEMAEKMTQSIIGEKPNTYVFTKALVENYLDFYKDTVPLCIVRPSIVTATLKEPVEGWVDNMNACSGLMIFCGKGLLRSLHLNGYKHVDFIPVDYLANLIILAGWNCQRLKQKHGMELKRRNSETLVYNGCAQSPLTYSEYIRLLLQAFEKYPFNNVLWYPSMSYTEWPLAHWFRDFIYHRIPMYCMDTLVLTTKSQNKKMSMAQLYNKIQASAGALEYFMNNGWKFYTNNVQNLYSSLTPQDQLLFPLFVKNVDWEEYINNYVVGLRRFTLKEQDLDLTTARQTMKRKLLMQRLLRILVQIPAILCFHFVYKTCGQTLLLKMCFFYQLFKPIVENIVRIFCQF